MQLLLNLMVQKQLLRKLLLLVGCLLPTLGFATPALTGELRDKWLLLNYYHADGDGFLSEITNEDYFLSKDGKTNPEAELEAFLGALREKKTDIICTFPARTTLILKEVPEFHAYARPDCSKFERHVNPLDIKGISLMFASGYFESPASYFGHTMIKFDLGNAAFSENFFDSSLNYGAKVTDSTYNPMYIYHGLTGGYTASYQRNNDFINTHSYTDKQMRDVWEYPLDLTAEERTLIVEMSTELRRARFEYYFFTDNCAHRIARIVEMATGRDLVDNDGGFLLPIQVIQQMKQAGIFKGEKRSVALRAKLREGFVALNKKDKADVVKYLKSSTAQQVRQSAALSTNALNVVRDFYDIEAAKGAAKGRQGAAEIEVQEHRRIVLAERLKRPPGQPVTMPVEEGLTPSELRRAGALQVGYVARPGDDAVTVRVQAANNDLLDKPLVGQEASRFIMGAAEAEVEADSFKIRRLTFLDIASLNTNPMPMSVTGDYSWGLKLGYGPRNNICRGCSTANFDLKVGKALRLNEDLMLYSLWGGQVNHKATRYNDVGMLTSENGLRIDLDRATRALVEVNGELSPTSGNPAYLFRGTVVRDLRAQRDLRFSVENDGKDSAVVLRLGVYF